MATAAPLVVPSWRGRMHTWAFFAAIPVTAALILRGSTPLDRFAITVYAVCVTAAFGTSAAYHRLRRSPRATAWLRRADHSTILLWIAGSYTAVVLLALEGPIVAVLLGVVWAGALVGTVLNLVAFDRTRMIVNVLFLAMGWCAILAGPALVQHLSPAELALIVAGGLIYTVGAVMLFTGRPDPRPAVFGYHEVWHCCTIAAGTCHVAAVWLLAA